ncbi:MAG: DUF1330 domain-containing protein [Pseudomonadota bacterium]
MSALMPSEEQIAKLQSLPPNDPVAVLNLFHFNEHAQYAPDDPEYGSPAANVTGQEAFARYSDVAGQFIIDLGGRVAFSTPVDQVMIGPIDPSWNVAAVMYFPSRRAFMQMLSNPEFQSASRHRKAALANHTMLHLAGAPFSE